MVIRNVVELSIIVGLIVVGACGNHSAPESKAEQTTAAVQRPVSKQVEKPMVEHIVFIGKKDACDCTRAQIDTTWQALQSALEGGPEVAVKRLQVDVDVDEANQYNGMQPMMALPGIYFLAGNKEIIKLLQGERRVDEIAEVLQ